ncbi:MAG TPA: hypothetical protein VFY35_03005, partial [Burkholderiaceae bacterium]|nr:hypothetical protein [Burkholderiaceae bacterium]
ARTEARYKALLQAADEHRRGDLDGRGNLTQAGLVDVGQKKSFRKVRSMSLGQVCSPSTRLVSYCAR